MIVGITRVRNEEKVLPYTLRFLDSFCSKFIIYDDCSEDDTVKHCKLNSKVHLIIEGKSWTPNRYPAEGHHRDLLYREALKLNPDYIYCFDADELLQPLTISKVSASSYAFQLFDFYITPRDIDTPWYEREWMGPEFRNIPMMFSPSQNPNLIFRDRVPVGLSASPAFGGYVKHFGKAISVENHERKCQYYIKYFGPNYKKKWSARLGKAVHSDFISDWGNPLIHWDERLCPGRTMAVPR